ncbi:MAG: hypothetical protein AAB905_00875 [Patescibacteria group bacterium]
MLRGSELNRLPQGYAYHYGLRRFIKDGFVVWTIPLSFPINIGLGYLPSSLYTFSDLTSELGSVLSRHLAGLHRF